MLRICRIRGVAILVVASIPVEDTTEDILEDTRVETPVTSLRRRISLLDQRELHMDTMHSKRENLHPSKCLRHLANRPHMGNHHLVVHSKVPSEDIKTTKADLLAINKPRTIRFTVRLRSHILTICLLQATLVHIRALTNRDYLTAHNIKPPTMDRPKGPITHLRQVKVSYTILPGQIRASIILQVIIKLNTHQALVQFNLNSLHLLVQTRLASLKPPVNIRPKRLLIQVRINRTFLLRQVSIRLNSLRQVKINSIHQLHRSTIFRILPFLRHHRRKSHTKCTHRRHR